MAIAFAQVKYLSRSKALQATAAAAYRSCSKIYDERTGTTFDYTNKKSLLLYSEILLPENADVKFKNRELLWNTVEKNETRNNSQVAKEVILALPQDDQINDNDKIELAKRFAMANFVNNGVVVDINIHNEAGNPHAHILITTRRLIGNQFDSHKARDLDPKVIRGQVQTDKVWGEEWRHFQNHYFLAKGLDLTVDANGIYSQIHLGKHIFHAKDRNQFDRWQENQNRHQDAKKIALTDPENVLNQITLHSSVFNDHDIGRLLHKHIDDPQEFQIALLKVKNSKKIILLGTGDDGKKRYTTRNIFELENNIQEVAENLNQRVSHSIHPTLIKNIINNYKLNDEQADAIQHILQGSDISIIVGRAGTGKTYALKAAKDAFTKAGYHVQGIALSGIAAQGLQEASGIPSRTIASFTYALQKETLKLTKDDIIILDEAGMTDTYALSEIINHIHKAQAKLILVGDEAQLQPIGPGAPFRALLERVGFAELQQIIRQEEPWQRKATHHLATGNIREALKSYQEHQHIHYNKTAKDAMHCLIDDWHHRYNQKHILLQQTLILAHRNIDVMQLNQIARAKRILAGEIDQGFSIKKGEHELWLSVNDRLIFRKNDPKLEVRNGQLGIIKVIESDNLGKVKSITVDLDNNKTVTFDPEHYVHFNHGYSATIHKTQGITVDHSFIYVAGDYWNRNLMYVAGSRHKKTMDLYIDQENHPNLESLIKGLDKDGMKDNMLDYPFNFAKRRGINIESLFARIKEHALEKLKTARKYLHEKYHQLIVRNEKITTQHHKQPEIVNGKQKGHHYLNNASSTQVKESDDDIKHTQEKFHKLLNDLDQAKILKNHYAVYRLKKEVQLEVKKIYKNKKLYQIIQTKMPEFAKMLGQYQSKQLEHDID